MRVSSLGQLRRSSTTNDSIAVLARTPARSRVAADASALTSTRWSSAGATALLLMLLLYPLALAVTLAALAALDRSVRHAELGLVIAGSTAVLAVVVLLAISGHRRLVRVRRDPIGLLAGVVRINNRSWFGAGELAGWSRAGVGSTAGEVDITRPRYVGPATAPEEQLTEAESTPTEAQVVRSAADPFANIPRRYWHGYTVRRGETWWLLAERQLDDGARWREIVAANVGRSVAAGIVVSDGDSLRAGWSILLPSAPHTRTTDSAESTHDRGDRPGRGDESETQPGRTQ